VTVGPGRGRRCRELVEVVVPVGDDVVLDRGELLAQLVEGAALLGLEVAMAASRFSRQPRWKAVSPRRTFGSSRASR
jgi:hypothetical protein